MQDKYELKIFTSVDDAEEVARLNKGTMLDTVELRLARAYLALGNLYIVLKNGKLFVQASMVSYLTMNSMAQFLTIEEQEEIEEHVPELFDEMVQEFFIKKLYVALPW